MIYNEVLANTLEADANENSIKTSLPDHSQQQNLKLTISIKMPVDYQ